MVTEQHDFVFTRDWVDGRRLCGECRLNYDQGSHTLIEVLKPYTRYVCPQSSGRTGVLGHSSRWTGAYLPEMRRRTDGTCTCGATFVEEDKELWRLTFEAITPLDPDWHQVTVIRSKHAALQQQAGLLELIDAGEPIRNVTLQQVSV